MLCQFHIIRPQKVNRIWIKILPPKIHSIQTDFNDNLELCRRVQFFHSLFSFLLCVVISFIHNSIFVTLIFHPYNFTCILLYSLNYKWKIWTIFRSFFLSPSIVWPFFFTLSTIAFFAVEKFVIFYLGTCAMWYAHTTILFPSNFRRTKATQFWME